MKAAQLAVRLSATTRDRARAGDRPQLLLLDEPAAGMNPSEQEDLMHLIKQIGIVSI